MKQDSLPIPARAPTRIGLIGLNDRARRLLLPGLMAAPRARLTAVCSRDLPKAQAVASALGMDVRPFGGPGAIEHLLAARDCELVYLNTPLATHVSLCTQLLEEGIGVICEKPLAPSATESAALWRLATARNLPLVVNFTYRSVPGFRLTERWLRQGQLGRLCHARFELLQGHHFFPGFPDQGALLDSGSHLFDVLATLLKVGADDQVAEVSATPCGPEAVDYGWAFTARTDAQVAVSGLFSRRALGWRNGLRWTLAGEAAALESEVDDGRTAVRIALRGDGAPQGVWRPLPLPDDLRADDERFPAYHLGRLVQAARGEAPFASAPEALATNFLAEALAESARTGHWVRVARPAMDNQAQ